MTTRIGILGVTGRMGRLLVEEVETAGAVVSGGTSRSDRGDVARFADADALMAASDVAIDFSHASLAAMHAAAAARAGVPLVLGTSGLDNASERGVHEAAARVALVYAANFAPGVNILLALAAKLAAALPPDQYDAEILEMHHRQKVDAPSGTALALGRAVAAGRGTTLEQAGAETGRNGHTGARGTGAIGFASLRGGQVVGEHDLIFAAASEQIVLTHRSFDRRVYATGAVRAALWSIGRLPGLYGMADVLELT